MGFLIDTSVWIDIERARISPAEVAAITGQEPIYVSPVTIAELQYGAEIAKSPELRLKRLAGVAQLKRKAVLPIDETTGEIFGKLAAHLKSTGRGRDFRIQDLWLSSQAIQHGLTLLTHNEKDFKDIPGIKLAVLISPPT